MIRWSGASSARSLVATSSAWSSSACSASRSPAAGAGLGLGAAIGIGLFVAVFAGILGGVVLIGIWAMKNEELIRGNETGHAAGRAGVPERVAPDPSLPEQATPAAADRRDTAEVAEADPVAVPPAGPDEGSVNQG